MRHPLGATAGNLATQLFVLREAETRIVLRESGELDNYDQSLFAMPA